MQTYPKDYENYIKFDSYEDFLKFCREGGWEDENGFYKDLKINYEEIRGKWFFTSHQRVYILTDEEMEEKYESSSN